MVDDTPANLLALEAILEPLGHCLVRAQSGQEALRHVLDKDFAAILMDVQMPGLDGFKTAALIKEREKSRHIPIIFITAISRDAEHVFAGYEHGAVDYLLKPFEPEILRCKVSVFVDLFLRGEEIKRQGELLRKQEREALERERLYEKERQARREAEAAAQAREDILAVVSHDLRNPLNAIFAGTALLMRYLPEGEERQGIEKQVLSIERSAERMNRLIGDLLDICRIEGNRLVVDAKSHEIAPLMSQVVEMLEPIAAQRNQRLEAATFGEGVPVYCDRERIFQVLSNLIGNAVKFGPEGSVIGLTAQGGEDAIRFTVTDRGPGIPEDQLSHIFDRYWQSGPNKRQGLGLGLAIAKGIIDAHGGQIWAESTPGGSSFHFELPRRKV
jgi:signal transduction histidine kinase